MISEITENQQESKDLHGFGRYRWWVLALILLLATLVRFGFLIKAQQQGLGRDELQSVTHAYLPLDELIRSVKEFDPHPPVYYIQLHYWLQVSTQDLWILVNPFLWGILTIISLFWTCIRIFNLRVAIVVAILCALAPLCVGGAVNVRMYSLIYFLSIWIWYFTHQFLTQDNKVTFALGIILTSLAYLYSQGSNFLVFTTSIGYAILLTLSGGTSGKKLFRYSLIQVVIFILYVPWLKQAYQITVGHTVRPTLLDLGSVTTSLLLSPRLNSTIYATHFAVGSISLFIFLMAVLILHRQSRNIVVAYVILPLAASTLISYLIRPIWVLQGLGFVISFLFIALALGIDDLITAKTNRYRQAIEWTIISISFALIPLSLLFHFVTYQKWYPPKQAVLCVKQHVQPEDVIYIPDNRSFWGWNWYYLGPGSINPREGITLLTSPQGEIIVSNPTIDAVIEPDRRYWVERGFGYTTAPFTDTDLKLHKTTLCRGLVELVITGKE